jgi:hypothetical protein
MKSESVVMRNYDNLHVEPKLVSVGVAMRTVKSSAFEFGRRKRLLHFLRLSKLARLLVCFNHFASLIRDPQPTECQRIGN